MWWRTGHRAGSDRWYMYSSELPRAGRFELTPGHGRIRLNRLLDSGSAGGAMSAANPFWPRPPKFLPPAGSAFFFSFTQISGYILFHNDTIYKKCVFPQDTSYLIQSLVDNLYHSGNLISTNLKFSHFWYIEKTTHRWVIIPPSFTGQRCHFRPF